MKIFLTFFLMLFIHGISNSQDNEYYFRFLYKQKSDLDKLTHLISIDDVRSDTTYAYANNKQWEEFRKLNYPYEELPHPGSLFEHEMTNSYSSIQDWDKYPTYQGYLNMMRQYEINYPHICNLDTFGYSVQGRQLLALKISDNAEYDEAEPEFLYTSTMHGDETVGYVLLLRLIDYLLTMYGQKTPEGQRVTNLVNNMEIWINPLANPDGTYRLGGDTTVSNARRNNANNVDLNRNFPDRINDPNNTTVGRQLETKFMMEFTAKRKFILSANFHGGAQVVNYPWDNGTPSGTYSTCPDDAWFINVSRVYATPNVDIMSGGFTNGITNGCQWYAIFGGRQDWIYYWHRGRETTIELWNTKNPPGSTLPQRWLNNCESFLAYMEEALKGIQGIVTDFHSELPLCARIDVVGISNSPVFSDSQYGNFYRLLKPGTYNIITTANNYRPDTLYGITVPNTGAVQVNIALKSTSTSISNIIVENTSEFLLFDNYPNPFNPSTIISYYVPYISHISIKIFDVLGREVKTLVNRIEEPGYKELEFKGQNFQSGVYYYRLQSSNYTQTKKFVLAK